MSISQQLVVSQTVSGACRRGVCPNLTKVEAALEICYEAERHWYLLGIEIKKDVMGKDCGKILYSPVCLRWEKSASVSASSTCTPSILVKEVVLDNDTVSKA
jgi:hypothetical protein